MADRMSLMELGRCLHSGEITLEVALHEMKLGSTSVLLSWGEDDGLWECSWIVGGKRYTAHDHQPRLAVLEAVVRCIRSLVSNLPHNPFGVDS